MTNVRVQQILGLGQYFLDLILCSIQTLLLTSPILMKIKRGMRETVKVADTEDMS